MSTGLRGTGMVADDLYLLAHHEVSGRPFLQPRTLGIGLAGALLAELMLAGGVALRHDGAVLAGAGLTGAGLTGGGLGGGGLGGGGLAGGGLGGGGLAGAGLRGGEVPGDGVGWPVLDVLAAERPLPVREWLLFLARTAAGDVARRLERSGYLRRAGGRMPWRRGRWVPVDADWAFAPLLRARSALDPARPWSVHGAVLAGLATACGLDFRLAQYASPADRSAEEAVSQLPGGLRGLIAHTQATAGSVLLCHRK